DPAVAAVANEVLGRTHQRRADPTAAEPGLHGGREQDGGVAGAAALEVEVDLPDRHVVLVDGDEDRERTRPAAELPAAVLHVVCRAEGVEALQVPLLAEADRDRLGYHVAPGTERRTSVICSHTSASSGVWPSRSVGSATAAASGRSSSRAATKRGSSSRRSNHICACSRWYVSSRSIFAARPATSSSSEAFRRSSLAASASS